MKYSKNFEQIQSNQQIFAHVKAEKTDIGYYALPYANVEDILSFSHTIKQNNIAVIGIGGSSLGAYAIHQFLRPKKTSDKKLHFFESTDPLDIQHRASKLDLEDTLFIVISKSGSTIETISIFKYLSSLTKVDHTNCVIISEHDSALTEYAHSQSMKTFEIPKNVGGRFSVFSNVGLVPLALIGVDIQALLDGCKEIHESFFNQQQYHDIIFEKARFLAENKNTFNINVLFSYSAGLEAFNKWYVQLWGESLGKIDCNNAKQGFTPIGLVGPVDQHSFLQLINEGTRDKTITFIKVEDFENDVTIPSLSIDEYVKLDYANGVTFQNLISQQCDATIKSLEALADIPYDVMSIEKVDEKSIAKLMYFYQLLTSVVGQFTNINTYNQPGVEQGKIILKESLG